MAAPFVLTTPDHRLRPHQHAPFEQLRAIFRSYQSAVDGSGTGTGKSYVGAAVASASKLPCLVVGPKVSRSVWARAAAHFSDEFSFCNYELLRTGNTDFGKWDKLKKSVAYYRCQCCQCEVDLGNFTPCPAHRAGIHCLETRKRPASYGNFHFHPGVKFIIFDECFPAGTMISTPSGYQDIATVAPGDFVQTPDGPKKITRVIKKAGSFPIVVTKHHYGHIYSTKAHRIATQAGWKKVEDLQPLQDWVLFEAQARGILFPRLRLESPVVRPQASSDSVRTNAPASARPEFKIASGGNRENDEAQSRSKPRNSKNYFSQASRAALSGAARGQRNRANRAAKASVGDFRAGVEKRIWDWGAKGTAEEYRLEPLHAGRFGTSGAKNSCGMRRSQPQHEESSGARQEESCYSKIARMGTLSLEERNDYAASPVGSVLDAGAADAVYDLEVEDAHVYFANGVLVSNCHRCNGIDSLNAELMIAAKRQNIKTLALSATMAQSPVNMRAVGYLLDLHSDKKPVEMIRGGRLIERLSFSQWLSQHEVRWDMRFKGYKWLVSPAQQEQIMKSIRADIFPARGVRVRPEDIPGFPERVIQVDTYSLDAPEKIDGCYQVMAAPLARLKEIAAADKDPESALTKILRQRQEIELLKVPAAAELMQDDLDKGFSVAAFVNFSATLAELKKYFPDAGVIDGTPEGVRNRDRVVSQYQANELRALLINSQAGGVSLSLQDLDGLHPRYGTIFPSFSAVDLIQCLGRFQRDSGRSRCYYRLLYAAGTIEARIAKAVQQKSTCIERLNDGDLTP